MNFSFTRNSLVFALLDVYWACALETCDFFPKSGGEGDCITSRGICHPLLTPTLKGGCMVPPKSLIEGSGSLSTPGYVVESV